MPLFPPNKITTPERKASGLVAVEMSREFSETVIPMAALLGTVLGGLVMFEAMIFSGNDLAIAVRILSHSVIGPFAAGVVGLILTARISAAQAAEIQTMYQNLGSDAQLALRTRTLMLSAGAFAAYVVFITCALTGAVIAGEWLLSGSSWQVVELVLLTRQPTDWVWDAIVAALIGLGISTATLKSASRGAQHHREISRTAGRAVSFALLAVCVIQTLYWLLRSLAR